MPLEQPVIRMDFCVMVPCAAKLGVAQVRSDQPSVKSRSAIQPICPVVTTSTRAQPSALTSITWVCVPRTKRVDDIKRRAWSLAHVHAGTCNGAHVQHSSGPRREWLVAGVVLSETGLSQSGSNAIKDAALRRDTATWLVNATAAVHVMRRSATRARLSGTKSAPPENS